MELMNLESEDMTVVQVSLNELLYVSWSLLPGY